MLISSLRSIENALSIGVFTVFLRNIQSGERFLGSHPKEVLYLYAGIAVFAET